MSKDPEDKPSVPEDENTDYQYTAREIEALRAILEKRKKDSEERGTEGEKEE